MKRVEINFTGQSYALRSKDVSAQRCVNFYPVKDAEGGRSNLFLMGTPGLTNWAGFGTGPCRGLFVAGDFLYVVSGQEMYRVTPSTAETLLGAMPGSLPVVMAYNGSQVMAVNGSAGFIYNTSTGVFSQITDPDFTGASHVVFIDGYFIFNVPNTGSFMLTAIGDGTSVDALDIATAEASPDRTVALAALNRNLVVLGEASTETWYNSGNPDFPFARSAVTDTGCVAPYSVANADNALFWLGRSSTGGRYVVSMRGHSIRAVSSPAIDFAINGYATVSDAIGSISTIDGHIFYDLTFPTANVTWSYNVRSGLWNEKSTNLVGRHRGQFSAFFDGKSLAGDFALPMLHALSATTYTDNGVDIISVRDSQPLYADGRRIVVKGLYIDVEAGVGLATGQGSDPKMMLSVSRDGGYSFEDEVLLTIGKIGQYAAQARRHNLGEAREWVFRVAISDPVKRCILGAYADIEVSKY